MHRLMQPRLVITTVILFLHILLVVFLDHFSGVGMQTILVDVHPFLLVYSVYF